VRREPEHTHYRRESESPTGKVLAGIKSSDQTASMAVIFYAFFEPLVNWGHERSSRQYTFCIIFEQNFCANCHVDISRNPCYTIIRKREGAPVSVGGLNPRGVPKGSRERAGESSQKSFKKIKKNT
jgi:hypothetical protein